MKLTGADLLNGFPRLMAAAESLPVLDVSASALMQLAERVRASGHAAAITGEGATSCKPVILGFASSSDWTVSTVRCLACRSAPGFRTYVRLVQSRKLPWSFVERSYRAVTGKNAWLLAYMLMAAAKYHFFREDTLTTLGDHLPFDDLALDETRMRRWHPLNRSIYLGIRVHLAGLHLAAR